MDFLNLIVKLFKNFLELPLVVQIISLAITMFEPVMAFILLIIFLVIVDYHTGIKASQVEEKKLNVVSSKKFRDKLNFLKMIGIGFISFLAVDFVLKYQGLNKIPFLDIKIDHALTTVYSLLVVVNELISILENLNRMGGEMARIAQPLIRILKIKTQDYLDKLGDKKDE